MGQDEVKSYLLMASSCDGSMATAVHLTSVRVVCNNTLRMSIGADASKAKIRVPHSASFEAEAVKQQLGIVGTAWGLVNAVTQYFDHETGGKGDKSRAFERAHLTDRAKFKTSIADRLLALAA